MQVLYERCAAVDVGKDVIAVAVRLPGRDGPDGRVTRQRTFKTFYGVLREAARWLGSLGVPMQARATITSRKPPASTPVWEPELRIQSRWCFTGP